MEDRFSTPTNVKDVTDIGCIEVIEAILYQISLLIVRMVDEDIIKRVYIEEMSRDRFEGTLVEANLKRIRTSLNTMLAVVYELPATVKDKADIGRIETIEAMLYQISVVMQKRFDEDRRSRVDTMPILDEDTVVESNLKRIKHSLSIMLVVLDKLMEA